MWAQQMLCPDYSNMQESRNISKLYMIDRGHWFPVLEMNVFCYFVQEIDVPIEISLDWN